MATWEPLLDYSHIAVGKLDRQLELGDRQPLAVADIKDICGLLHHGQRRGSPDQGGLTAIGPRDEGGAALATDLISQSDKDQAALGPCIHLGEHGGR